MRGLADVAAGTPVRPETRFQIGSISKSFAGIVALQEAEAGRLDLHVSVNEILPWLELPEPFGPITLHHLMQHTAGLAIGDGGCPDARGRPVAAARRAADRAAGGALLVLERRLEDRRRLSRARDRHADRTS